MVAMTTVWFGFVYSVMWVVTVGLVASIVDKLLFTPVAAPAIERQQQMMAYMQSSMVPAGGM
jgi:hypothetical protein